jgi:hypothetical protein
VQDLPLPTKESPESFASAVTNVTFYVASIDRLVDKASVNVQFSFITSDGGSLDSGDYINLYYPTGFFSYSEPKTIRAVVSVCDAQLKVYFSATYLYIQLNNCDSAYSVGSTISVQLIGVTIGPTPTAGGPITVSTSKDTAPSESIPSGPIAGAVAYVAALEIADSDRVANKAGVPVTFSFTPSAGGALSASNTITLNYPPGFFAPQVTPSISLSGGATATADAAGYSSIVITVQSGTVAANVLLNITLNSMTMGQSATAGAPVSVTTSQDILLLSTSTAPSGVIHGPVTFNSFGVASSDRVINKQGVSVTFNFYATPIGSLQSKDTITLNYPKFFFASGVFPTVVAAGCDLISGPSHDSSIVLTVQSGSVQGAAITLLGMTVGPSPTPGGPVNMSTSKDYLLAANLPSGNIVGAVTSVEFGISSSDRAVNKAGVPVTFSFTPSAGGALSASNTITLNYPPGFFAPQVTPSISLSGGATATADAAGYSSIVITVQSGTVAADAAVTVTMNGMTLGSTPTTGGPIIVSSSQDILLSSSIPSGSLGDAPTNVAFAIADSDRVANKAGVPVTFSFTPSAGGALSASNTITLNYPPGFFAPQVTPSISLSGGATATADAAGYSSIVITVQSGTVAADAAVTVTMNGMTLGSTPTTGGPIIVSSSQDILLSSSIPSGSITPDPLNVKAVHVLTAWHLDIGFADTIANIVNRYLDSFYTDSAQVATHSHPVTRLVL